MDGAWRHHIQLDWLLSIHHTLAFALYILSLIATLTTHILFILETQLAPPFWTAPVKLATPIVTDFVIPCSNLFVSF
jgi:hypothetical protein